jgi:uncharacterized protein YbjT (DUF2867 family)
MFTILGATGKIGRSTIHALREAGVPVKAVVRNRATAGDLEATGCEIAVADIRNKGALANALRDAEVVQVICPADSRAEHAEAEMVAAIAATVGALDEARPRAVLAISDYGANLEQDTGITRLFHILENDLKRTGLPLTILRSSEHMENWARVARRAIETGILLSLHDPVTKKFPTISAPDVGVIAADLLLSADRDVPLRIVHAEGPERYSVKDVANLLQEIVGRTIMPRSLSPTERLPALTAGGMSGNYAELVATMFEIHNAGLIDVEAGVGQTRLGTTPMKEVLTRLILSTGG